MKILIAIDASDSSHKALQQVLRLITHEDVTLILLGVEEPQFIPSASPLSGVFGEDPSIVWQEEVALDQLEKKRTATALQWATNLCQQTGIHFVTRSELGDPKHIICDVAKQENCDLIVVGSHSQGMIDRVLMGSVSDYVVHHAHCAVLVVR